MFRGIIPSLVTPWAPDGSLDEIALRTELRWVLIRGVHGVVVGGSAGEGHLLTLEEIVRLTQIAGEEVGGQIPVIAGVIRPSTSEAVQYARALQEAGADGLQITPLHYFSAPTQSAIEVFYGAIADAVSIPMIVFNLASRRGTSVEMLQRLAQRPNIAAVKQSGGDIHKLADVILANDQLPADDRFTIVTALDDLLYPSFILGAHAAITTSLVVVPDLAVQLWNACEQQDHVAARQLHSRILQVERALTLAPDRYPRIRAAMEIRGIPVGPPRAPSEPATSSARAEIRAGLTRANVESI